ncbi:MAG: DUF4242 domain-containing protein [Bdellovibrionales bacterium]
MPKYIIERDLSGAGKIPKEELKAIAQRANKIAAEMDNRVTWLESFITDDRLYCVYIAPDAESIREHATKGKFPCTRVSEVRGIIDKTTAE